MSQSSRPFVLAKSSQTVSRRLSTPPKKDPKRNSFLAYLLGISFIGLIVRIFRVSWRIVAFIITAMNSKKISNKQEMISLPQQKLIPSQIVETEEKHLSPYQPRMHGSESDAQLKEHFLTMASHELKTPMTTIVGQTQLLLRRLSNLPELSSELVSMRTALESIDGQTRRLNTLVDDLLDLHNVRSGKVKLRLEACNLVAICLAVVQEQRLLTGRIIALEAPMNTVQMYADVERLHQVVVNMVSNALRYSSEQSLVKVQIYQNRDIGIIEVQDNGVGIPKEQLTHIFEPFYRGPTEQLSSKSGLGLGLAICKDIVERHNGRIWCRSRLGKGSTFIVELPLNKRAMQQM